MKKKSDKGWVPRQSVRRSREDHDVLLGLVRKRYQWHLWGRSEEAREPVMECFRSLQEAWQRENPGAAPGELQKLDLQFLCDAPRPLLHALADRAQRHWTAD